MNLSDEIRKQIEKNKGLKLAVGEINNHLSILEDLVRKDIMEQVDEAYQKGVEEGKKAFDLLESERNSEYQRGLDDAWECAKKLFSTMSDTEIEKVFPTEWENGFYGLMQMKPQYAIEKLKAYEEKQSDKIEVRDEVVWTKDENVVIFVTSVYTDDNNMEWCDGVTKDGKAYRILTKNARKTGRHFDIEKVLEAMKS